MLWEVDICSAEGQPDLGADDVVAAAAELHLADCGAAVPAARAGETPEPQGLLVISIRGYLIQGDLDRAAAMRIANELLADRVVEMILVAPLAIRP